MDQNGDGEIDIDEFADIAHHFPKIFAGVSGEFVDDGSTPVDRLETPQQIDLWSFAVTLYEMATGSPLFPNNYDQATPATFAKLKNWGGLDMEHLSQIESLHGGGESATLRDVLMWTLGAHAMSRPQSVAELAAHAFFDPQGGAMRANFAVNEIKQLLIASPLDSSARVDVNVMISYCWSDTDFVLSQLAVEVAPRVCSMWLDRLGGEQGMGEFARASMQRGVENADVIIAVVSPSYIASANCGYEMGMAHKYGKLVIPVVLNVPFQEWPPQQIGQTKMNEQFATAAGDVKIFVDMSDPQKFFQKFKHELLPRLKSKRGVVPTTITSQTDEASDISEHNAALESDDAGKIVAPKSGVHRPKKGKKGDAGAAPTNNVGGGSAGASAGEIAEADGNVGNGMGGSVGRSTKQTGDDVVTNDRKDVSTVINKTWESANTIDHVLSETYL